MTELENLKPCREFDTIVAQEVMEIDGLCRCRGNLLIDANTLWSGREKHAKCGGVIPKPYSTSIAAAWEMVERFRPISITYGVGLYNKWYVAFGHAAMAYSETIPHAICLAALKAVRALKGKES